MKRLLPLLLLMPSLAFGANIFYKDASGNTLEAGVNNPFPIDVRSSQLGNATLASNSSTTPLNASATFTGSWVDVSSFDSIVVAVKTDQNGTFTIQFSPDGTNADSTLTRYYRTDQIEAPHRFTITRQYARVTFTNTSASNQTYLRLQTTLGTFEALNAPIDGVMAQDFDAIATRPTEYRAEVALGRRQGATVWNKFGYNDDIDTATDPEILASWGGTFQHLTSGETLTIASTSTADDGDPAGTGANSLVVYGVDENWDLQTEIVTLDGTTNVVTSTQWIGINRISIYLAGSGKANAGNITITATSSGYTLAQMLVGQGTSQQCVFYVPQNYQFLTDWLYTNAIKLAGGGGDPEVTVKGWVFSAVSNAYYEVYRDVLDTANDNRINLNPPEYFIIGEKSILYFTGETDKDNTGVRCRFSGKLVGDVDR